jgi:hypothetical protein
LNNLEVDNPYMLPLQLYGLQHRRDIAGVLQIYLRKRVLKLVFLSQFLYKFVNLCGEQRIS